MNYYLKELDLNMGKDVYDMYQDIPAKESGSTNDCFGLNFDEFPKYLEKEINRKNNKVTYDDTPTITYIMYVNNNVRIRFQYYKHLIIMSTLLKLHFHLIQTLDIY